ncbi:hypothetical protein JVX90_00045 [Gordonia sp. PDNC005]|uniref:hypothetical protein n=1 Tax=Gordonia sp. PDNC005 TaxID=2811424 RepID=UPI0019655805|nr:hypothetical protein [Gordonia sp. PDNC005]QRY62703.1 hypothetical protein JVX90_00045 [Gordonia sp. PDNC005]
MIAALLELSPLTRAVLTTMVAGSIVAALSPDVPPVLTLEPDAMPVGPVVEAGALR